MISGRENAEKTEASVLTWLYENKRNDNAGGDITQNRTHGLRLVVARNFHPHNVCVCVCDHLYVEFYPLKRRAEKESVRDRES